MSASGTHDGGSRPGSGARSDGSERSGGPAGASRPEWLRWPPTPRTGAAAGAAALAAVVAALALSGAFGSDDDPGAQSPTEPTATAAPSATPEPSSPSTPTPTPNPTPAPAPAVPGDPTAPSTEGATGDAPADVAVLPPEAPELAPVPLSGGEADFGTQVAARMTDVARVEGEGQGLGERSGPALAVTVEMTNGTAETVDLSLVVVNIADAAGSPGQMLLGDPRSAPFTGTLAPGASRSATYVLRLPEDDTSDVTVTLSYGAEAPTAVFSGPVPD